MLGDNIKTLRKQKGYSQETLAAQLNVVRQTVSKWEKGISVPDAEMLNRIADLFEVPVSTLLGTVPEMDGEMTSTEAREIAQQLAILNEQLAKKNSFGKRVLKTILIVLGVIAAIFIILAILGVTVFAIRTSSRPDINKDPINRAKFTCELDGEEYTYSIYYDDNYQIYAGGGDAWISNHVMVEQYEDANVLIAQMEDYFEDRGGTVEIAYDIVEGIDEASEAEEAGD